MKKRGIESLISWILIIGFTIALGTFITIWAINLTKDVDPGRGSEDFTYCDNIQVTINDTVCIDATNSNKNIKISVLNKGTFSIWNLTLDRETSENPLESCLINRDKDNNILQIKPKEAKIIIVNAVEPFASDNLGLSIEECPIIYNSENYPTSPSTFTTRTIAITPWIKTEKGDVIACQTKKITINDPSKLPRDLDAPDPACV